MKRLIIKFFPEKKLVLLLPYVLLASLFIILPMILLLVKSMQPVANVDNFDIVKSEYTWQVLGRSIFLGLIAALLSLVISFPYAWVVARSQSRFFKSLALTLLLSPLAIFSIAKIFALRIMLIRMYDYNPENIKQKWIMVLGMIYMYLPFMIIPLFFVINNMPNSLIEASHDLGYGIIKTIFKIILPYCMKAIFSGLAIVFMLSSTSLVMSNTLIRDNDNNRLIGNLIETQTPAMQNGSSIANAWGSTLALVTIVIIMGAYGLIYLAPILWRLIRQRWQRG